MQPFWKLAICNKKREHEIIFSWLDTVQIVKFNCFKRLYHTYRTHVFQIMQVFIFDFYFAQMSMSDFAKRSVVHPEKRIVFKCFLTFTAIFPSFIARNIFLWRLEADWYHYMFTACSVYLLHSHYLCQFWRASMRCYVALYHSLHTHTKYSAQNLWSV